jgi:diguanylate cyclase (GGDEF)-like protein
MEMNGPQMQRRRGGSRGAIGIDDLLQPFVLATLLLVAVAAGFLHEGGTGRPAELVLVGLGVAAAYVVSTESGRGIAIGITVAYAVVEARFGRLDALHAWTQILYGTAILGAGLAAAQTAADRRLAGAAGLVAQAAAHLPADPLADTLAGGRRMNSIDYELERARRHGHELGLLVVRPDEIADVIDRFGESGAAAIFAAVAEAIGENLRGTDIPLRQGATDFAVILPETSSVSARMVAERIRLAVAGRRREFGPGDIVDVTVSIGIAGFPTDATSAGELVSAGIRALDYAIEVGGNRSFLHSVPADSPAGWGLAPTPQPNYSL